MAGHVKRNYRQKKIPQSLGIVFLPVYVPAAFWAARQGLVAKEKLLAVFLLTFGFCLLGFLDDLWGSTVVKGFSGHFRQFFARGQITTGLVKAVLGFGLCLYVVFLLSGLRFLLIFEASLIALSANLLNLFDLRPGRALKVFFLFALFWLLLLPQEEHILLLFPFFITALVLLPYYLHGAVMLGDAGANLLGKVLGLAVVLYANFWWQLLFLVLLLSLHLLAERISLTGLIARYPLLTYLDRLGRTD